MAAATGLSRSSDQRVWRAHELNPHRVKTFKLPNDKRFVEKVQDIVGLYPDPPDKALVFSADETSQVAGPSGRKQRGAASQEYLVVYGYEALW